MHVSLMHPLIYYVEAARSQLGACRPDEPDEADFWDGLTAVATQLRTAASEGGEAVEPVGDIVDSLTQITVAKYTLRHQQLPEDVRGVLKMAARALAHPPEVARDAGRWPARFCCNGPEGSFWTDDSALANKLIASTYDRDEWTVTDTQQAAISGAAGGGG